MPRDKAFWLTWRSTVEERAMPLPCDDEMPGCEEILHRAIDIAAPSDLLFRWLCQLQVAPYSYDWIDNFGRRSPRELIVGTDDLKVGDRVMTIFTLKALKPGRLLTIRMTHPSGLRIFGDIAISYHITPMGDDCRLLVRMRLRYPNRLPYLLMRYLLPFGDWVMAQKQLRTFRNLVQRDAIRCAAHHTGRRS